MRMSQLLRRATLLLLSVPFIALVFSHSVPWMAYPRLACPLDKDSMLPEIDFRRSEFPDSFLFGAATAAFQVEGAVSQGGRGQSIWDSFSRIPGNVVDSGVPDVTVDEYHRYEEDTDLLKSMHMDSYRFSISWSRIFPDGRGREVNKEGVAYYSRLIDALVRKGLQPYVTLYHWDLPQALQDSIGGWPSREIVKYFAAYAEACFSAFGNRVKHWITFNEPQQFTWLGYGEGVHAPGRTSDRVRSAAGNTSTEPYLAAHNVLLAHAAAVDIYRKHYQAAQGGVIGISTDCEYAEPLTDSPKDAEAAQRRMLFQLGWFLDPIFFGDYPKVMRDNAGSRLPWFTADEVSLLHRSVDFIGLNHYTTKWVTSSPWPSDPVNGNYWNDQCIITSAERNGVSIGPQAYSYWLNIVPWGVEKLILWVWNRYKMPIFITENGMDMKNNQTAGQTIPSESIHDTRRIAFYYAYLKAILSAIRKGADVRGYYAWTLLDNFEWAMGYSSRYGLFYTDFYTLQRYPKDSALWFTKFLQPRDLGPCEPSES